jgi:RNA polymerase sigma factor (sigma-70 family)
MAQAQLTKLFIENRDMILGFIFALTGNPDLAEEIFQDVALVILEEDRKGTQVNKYLPWVREIARRRVSEYYRKWAKRRALERPSASFEEVVCKAFAENEIPIERNHARLHHLRECLSRLSDRSREVINRFYHDRKSIRDIAHALDWQENSVKVALSRARKALADCIHDKLLVQEAT